MNAIQYSLCQPLRLLSYWVIHPCMTQVRMIETKFPKVNLKQFDKKVNKYVIYISKYTN